MIAPVPVLAESVLSHPDLREFDGVICFGGEDWWYHNRGHYDMRIMRELSKRVPVLYVNSLGMRVPSAREGGMFLHRIRRKLDSLRRGLVKVAANFHVFSPLYVPGESGSRVFTLLLAAQVRHRARALGIKKPLVWVACPSAHGVVHSLDAIGMAFQRTDRFEAFPGVDSIRIEKQCRALSLFSDLTVFCAPVLYEREKADCRAAAFIDHGVEFARFERAGRYLSELPSELNGITRPKVGFIGALDSHTFDQSFFLEVAAALPQFEFVLVGSSSFPSGSFDAPNITRIGQVSIDSVQNYMAACEVLIMPWNRNEWIRACNPVKLKEYLAVGRPVVSTPYPALDQYRDWVAVAETPAEFARSIFEAHLEIRDAASSRRRVRHETWVNKGREVLEALAREGLVPTQDTRGVELYGGRSCPV